MSGPSLEWADYLRDWMTENGASVAELSSVIRRPRRTVLGWLNAYDKPSGRPRVPSVTEQSRIRTCLKLQSKDSPELSVDWLTSRFEALHTSRESVALTLLPMAAAQLFLALRSHGFTCSISVSGDMNTTLAAEKDSARYELTFLQRPETGLTVATTIQEFNDSPCLMGFRKYSESLADSILEIHNYAHSR